MLKRTWSLLLVLTLCAAPAAAFAPDRAANDSKASLVEWVWSGIARLLDLDDRDARDSRREGGKPRTTTAADDSGGHYDPNG